MGILNSDFKYILKMHKAREGTEGATGSGGGGCGCK